MRFAVNGLTCISLVVAIALAVIWHPFWYLVALEVGGEADAPRDDPTILLVAHVRNKSTPLVENAIKTIHRSPRRGRLEERDVCFVTAEFGDNITDMDQIPEPEMVGGDFRYFAFTNQEDYNVPSKYAKIVLTDLPYMRQITQSRWPKFMGWKHSKLTTCKVLFYGDAYVLNPVRRKYWIKRAVQIHMSEVGLMQGGQLGSNSETSDPPIAELERNVELGKVGGEEANITIQWLKSRPDYRPKRIKVYKNAIFGYDPSNEKFRNFVEKFWKEYSREVGSWRDQSYWAYYLYHHRLQPLAWPFSPNPPMGSKGRRGHNGHVYVEGSQISLSSADICFVTANFADSVQQSDEIPKSDMEGGDFRYYAFTNQESLVVPANYTKIVIKDSELPYTKQITRMGWFKFMGWKHTKLATCKVIFYADAYKMNPIYKSYWMLQAIRILKSQGGLLQQLEVASNAGVGDSLVRDITRNVIADKLDAFSANITFHWLRSQPDYDPQAILVYKTDVFGYNPSNEKFRALAEDFWHEYSKETGSWHEQSYWAYFLHRHKIAPVSVRKKPRMGLMGRKGYTGAVFAEMPIVREKRKGTLFSQNRLSNVGTKGHNESFVGDKVGIDISAEQKCPQKTRMIADSVTFEPDWIGWIDSHYLNKDNPALFTEVVDKILVKDYVKQLDLPVKVARTYWNSSDASSLSLHGLPASYVIKSNHASDTVIPVRNGINIKTKEAVNVTALRRHVSGWLKQSYGQWGELWYTRIEPQVFVEEFLEGKDNKSPPQDYKLHVFHQKVILVQVDLSRFSGHKRHWYNRYWIRVPISWAKHKGRIDERWKDAPSLPKPEALERMVASAERLAAPFDYVRVDFFVRGDNIWFSELTFAHAGGKAGTQPRYVNNVLGYLLAHKDRVEDFQNFTYPGKRALVKLIDKCTSS